MRRLSPLVRGSLLDSVQHARAVNSNVDADQSCLETLCQEACAHGAPLCGGILFYAVVFHVRGFNVVVMKCRDVRNPLVTTI